MSELLFIDFETFFDTSTGYTLAENRKQHVSLLEYIRSPKFQTLGMAYRWRTREDQTHWLSGDHAVRAFLGRVDWANTIVVAHNVKFDGAILKWIYGHKPLQYRDTLSMARAVLGYSVRKHSLAALAEHYGLPPKGFLATDGLRELTPQQAQELGDYCKHDTDLCAAIYDRLAAQFPATQYAALDWTVRAFIEPMLKLDGAKLAELHAAEQKRRAEAIEKTGVPKAVFSSNKKFPELLASEGYEVPYKKNKKGASIPALSTSDEGFNQLRNTEDERLAMLLDARIAAKSCLMETRAEKFMRLATLDQWPFDLHFSGAIQTHRYSGANGAGGNPQNLPARGPNAALRSAVTAPAGYKIVCADFSTIELRFQAWLAKEPKLTVELQDRKGDPYCAFASRYYRRTITKADKAERQFGKTCILGLGYGMGPKKFRQQAKLTTGITLTEDESKQVVGFYRLGFPGIPNLWNQLDDMIGYMASGTTLTLPGAPFLQIEKDGLGLPSGLKVRYPNLRQDDQTRDWIYDGYRNKTSEKAVVKLYGGRVLENICQSLAGELCKIAIERAESWGVRCTGQIHDEILAVVPDADAEKAAVILRKAMETPPSWWPSLRVFSEVGVGNNWLEAKKAAK